MKKENKYVVIGGQYAPVYYGATPTLIGAKRLANKNKEYWDNWQGRHTPRIYSIEDVEYNDDYDPNDLYDCEVKINPFAVPVECDK